MCGMFIRLTDIINEYVEVQGPKDRKTAGDVEYIHEENEMAVYVSFEDFDTLLSRGIGLSV
jgi:hypothetical protein